MTVPWKPGPGLGLYFWRSAWRRLPAIARECHVAPKTYYERRRRGWTFLQAMNVRPAPSRRPRHLHWMKVPRTRQAA